MGFGMEKSTETNRGIVIIMTDPPYSTPLLHDKLTLIEIIANKYEQVILFFYLDGIHQLNDNQMPQNFPNIAEIHKKLKENHTNITYMACSRCTGARGYIDPEKSDFASDVFHSDKLLPFVKIVSLRKLAKFKKKGYSIIQI